MHLGLERGCYLALLDACARHPTLIDDEEAGASLEEFLGSDVAGRDHLGASLGEGEDSPLLHDSLIRTPFTDDSSDESVRSFGEGSGGGSPAKAVAVGSRSSRRRRLLSLLGVRSRASAAAAERAEEGSAAASAAQGESEGSAGG